MYHHFFFDHDSNNMFKRKIIRFSTGGNKKNYPNSQDTLGNAGIMRCLMVTVVPLDLDLAAHKFFQRASCIVIISYSNEENIKRLIDVADLYREIIRYIIEFFDHLTTYKSIAVN